MTVPLNVVVANGVGVILDDQANTWVQGGCLLANLRNFVGVSSMTVIMLGYTAPGDGGAGCFFWQNGTSFVDDGGLTTIVPYGVADGAWIRDAFLVTTSSPFAAITVAGTSDLQGNVLMQSALVVDGATSFMSTMNVDGNAQFLSNVTASGGLSVGGSFTVGTNALFSSSVVINGTLEVSGIGEFNGAISVGAGNSGVAGNFAVAGAFQTNGSAVIGGTIAFGSASGPTITTGAGAPVATQPQGSIYLRTAGGVGSTLYVTQGGGVWNAVAGV